MLRNSSRPRLTSTSSSAPKGPRPTAVGQTTQSALGRRCTPMFCLTVSPIRECLNRAMSPLCRVAERASTTRGSVEIHRRLIWVEGCDRRSTYAHVHGHGCMHERAITHIAGTQFTQSFETIGHACMLTHTHMPIDHSTQVHSACYASVHFPACCPWAQALDSG